MEIHPHSRKMTRFWAICAAICLAAAALCQKSSTITFKTDGASLRTVLKEVSEKVGGTPVYAAEPLASEPVFVRVQDVEYMEFLKRLSECVGGELINNANRYEIRPKAGPNLEEIRYQNKLKQILELQSKAQEVLAKMPPFDTAAAKSLLEEVEQYFQALSHKTAEYDPNDEKVGQKAPTARLVREVFVALPAADLAKLGPKERLVWSSRPTRVQKPLPPAILQAVSSYVTAQKVWTDTLGGRKFNHPEDRGLPRNIYQLLQNNFQWGLPEANSDDTATLVLVSCRSYGGPFKMIEVKLVNKAGRYVQSANLSTHELNDTQTNPNADKKSTALPQDDRLPKGEIAMPEGAAVITDALRKTWVNRSSGLDPVLDPVVQERLIQPEVYDPISLCFGSTAVALADKHDIQLVGSVPDFHAFYFIFGLEKNELGFNRLLQTGRKDYNTIDYSFENNWLVIKEKSGVSEYSPIRDSYGARASRANLGTFMRTAKQAGRVSLETLARYAANLPPENSEIDFLLMFYSGLAFGQDRFMYVDLDQLRFYGSLDEMQLRTMRAGGALPFSSLRPLQKQFVTRTVYSGEMWEMEFHPNESDDDAYMGFHDGIVGEPTYRYGNGILPTTTVTMDEKIQFEIVGKRAGKYGEEVTSSDLKSFGESLFYSEVDDPGFRGGHYNREPYSSFQVKETRTIRFRFALDPELAMGFSLNEDLRSLAKADDMSKLPKVYLDEIMKGKEDARKTYEEYKKHAAPPVVPPYALRTGT